MRRFEKRYENRKEVLRSVRRDLVRFARECRIGEQATYELVAATGEALANAIEHGHVPGSKIEVTCTFENLQMSIRVRDSGGGIAAADKTWEREFRKPGAGGYGFTIMRGLMDEVQFKLIPGDGAELRMVTRYEKHPALRRMPA